MPHVAQVVVVSPHDTGISRARGEDRSSGRARWPKLLAAGELDAVWMPDEWTRAMRRRLARRGQLVPARTRAKNEIHVAFLADAAWQTAPQRLVKSGAQRLLTQGDQWDGKLPEFGDCVVERLTQNAVGSGRVVPIGEHGEGSSRGARRDRSGA